jgi:hypothetical protein
MGWVVGILLRVYYNVTGVSAETEPPSFSSPWHTMIALFASNVLSLLWRREGCVQCSDGQSDVSKSIARAWLQTDRRTDTLEGAEELG